MLRQGAGGCRTRDRRVAHDWTKSWIGWGAGAWLPDTWILYGVAGLRFVKITGPICRREVPGWKIVIAIHQPSHPSRVLLREYDRLEVSTGKGLEKGDLRMQTTTARHPGLMTYADRSGWPR